MAECRANLAEAKSILDQSGDRRDVRGSEGDEGNGLSTSFMDRGGPRGSSRAVLLAELDETRQRPRVTVILSRCWTYLMIPPQAASSSSSSSSPGGMSTGTTRKANSSLVTMATGTTRKKTSSRASGADSLSRGSTSPAVDDFGEIRPGPSTPATGRPGSAPSRILFSLNESVARSPYVLPQTVHSMIIQAERSTLSINAADEPGRSPRPGEEFDRLIDDDDDDEPDEADELDGGGARDEEVERGEDDERVEEDGRGDGGEEVAGGGAQAEGEEESGEEGEGEQVKSPFFALTDTSPSGLPSAQLLRHLLGERAEPASSFQEEALVILMFGFVKRFSWSLLCKNSIPRLGLSRPIFPRRMR